MTSTNNHSRKRISLLQSRRTLIIIGLILLALVIIVGWWAAWRPANSDYDKAYGSITGAQLTASTFSKDAIKDVNIAALNRQSVSAIGARSVFYQQSIRTLSGSAAVAHDHVVGNVFNTHKQRFVDFGKQIDDFAGSLLIYVNASESCGDMVNNLTAGITREEFNTRSQSCRDIISNSPPAPYKEFNDFYQSYRTNIKAVISNYNTYFDAQDKKDQGAIDKTSKTVQESLSRAITDTKSAIVKVPDFSPPVKELTEIKSKLDSQKSVFFKW